MASSNNSQNVINFVKRRKSDLISVFDSKCCLCGFNAYQEALEFHHVDPSTKEFGITTASTTKALASQLAEMRKCILVCANCHRGIHAGYLTIPSNWPTFFHEDVAQQLLTTLDNKRTHKVNYCQRCGKEISRKATHCPECQALMSRATDRPSREELKALIRTMPFTHIAMHYGVSDNAIRKWCDAERLPRTKKAINQYSDDEWQQL